MTDDHAVPVNGSAGLYWVFSLEKASLVKAGGTFRNVTPEMAAKGGSGQAALRVNPERGGPCRWPHRRRACPWRKRRTP